MTSERTSGLLENLSGLHSGDHVCWSYGSDEEHRRTLTSFMLEGLERGERLVYFSHRYAPATICGYLEETGADAESLMRSAQLLFIPATAAYTPDGQFEPKRMLDQFTTATDQAIADGFTGLRASAETEWLLPALSDSATLLEFEFCADKLTAGSKLTGLCGYDRRHTDPSLLLRLETIHPARSKADSGAQTTFCLFSSPSGKLMVEGEIDLLGRDAWRDALRIASDFTPSLSLDMSRVTFIDAGSLRLLAQLAKELFARAGSVSLVSLNPTARKCLELLDFSSLPGLHVAGP